MSPSDVQTAIDFVRVHVPGYRVVPKADVWWMRLLGHIMFFNHGFMTGYCSTIGRTTYAPPDPTWPMIIHEGRHAYQNQQGGTILSIVSGLAYALPQILAVVPLVLATFLSFSWLYIAAGIVLLCPLPAYFRMETELDAYAVEVLAKNLAGQGSIGELADQFSDFFFGSSYYWMWPFNSIRQRLYMMACNMKFGVIDDPYIADFRLADRTLRLRGQKEGEE